MPIIRTHEKNVETVCYGEMMGYELKTIFGDELTYKTLKAIEDDDSKEVEVKYINFENDYLLIISFDGVEVLEQKRRGRGTDMCYFLNEFEARVEEEEEE